MSTRKRKNDGIYRRADSPYWWACYPDGRGRSTRRSTGIAIVEDPDGLKALAMRAAWRAQGHVERTGVAATFDDLMLLYLREETPKKRAPERDEYAVKALYPFFSRRTLESLNASDARGYIAYRKEQGIAASTINKEVSMISVALNWARNELDWDIANPFLGRHQPEPPGRQRWLTPEEADRLLSAADRQGRLAPWLPNLIRLALNTGMRTGELRWLEWARVDLADGRIRFAAATTGPEKTGQKNGKPGFVPINQGARAALIAQLRFRAEHCPDARWVFCRENGARVTSLQYVWNLCTQAADLHDLHPHDLRRTFGSWLVQAGVGIERVSALLRHSNVAITARVYAHLRPSDLAEAAAVLDRSGPSFHADCHASPEKPSHRAG